LYGVYEHLVLNDPPQPVDLIFVLAGRMERKPYGLELYRAGFAPKLLLSVGRFEVSRMRALGLERANELIALRDLTAPDERHFFLEISAAGSRIERPKIPQWNTFGEVVALREYLQDDMPRSMLIVSTDVHLRRVALTIARVFGDAPLNILYCPVPVCSSALRKDGWWRRPEDRRYVLKETIKLAAYRAVLSLPEAMVRRIMRLKNWLK
jgi:uncharacterized SAM-binding protein YcdF (DUF218 family)